MTAVPHTLIFMCPYNALAFYFNFLVYVKILLNFFLVDFGKFCKVPSLGLAPHLDLVPLKISNFDKRPGALNRINTAFLIHTFDARKLSVENYTIPQLWCFTVRNSGLLLPQ